MPKNPSNDKNHVMIAWLNPKQLTLAISRILRTPPPPTLVVFLDRTTKTFNILEVSNELQPKLSAGS